MSHTLSVTDLVDLLIGANGMIDVFDEDWFYKDLSREGDEVQLTAKLGSVIAMSSASYGRERGNLTVSAAFDVEATVPYNEMGLDIVNTRLFRSFSLIRDGELKLYRLPVFFKEEHATKLEAYPHKVVESDREGYVKWVFYLKDLELLGQVFVDTFSSFTPDDLAHFSIEAMQWRARQRVLKGKLKEEIGRANRLMEKYGADAAEWLATIGIQEYGYAHPKNENLVEKEISYPVIETKIKGFSSLPTVKSVEAKLDEGKKLTPREELMVEAIQRHQNDSLEDVRESLDNAAAELKRMDDVIARWVMYKIVSEREDFSIKVEHENHNIEFVRRIKTEKIKVRAED